MNIICINQSFKMTIFKLMYNVTIGMILSTFFFYQITPQNLDTRYILTYIVDLITFFSFSIDFIRIWLTPKKLPLSNKMY